MDVTQFAWPLEPSATSAIAAGNATTAGSAADEEVDTLISVVMWGCVAAQCATSFLGWKTITNRASELFQYLWGFGMMYSMAMFFSGVTGAEHNDAWVDVRFISYNVLTYGTAYLTLPKAIDNVVGQEVGEISDLARGAVEIVTQLIVIVGTSFVVGGHGWFSHDILEHLPIALFGITNTVNAVVGDRYSQLNGKLSAPTASAPPWPPTPRTRCSRATPREVLSRGSAWWPRCSHCTPPTSSRLTQCPAPALDSATRLSRWSLCSPTTTSRDQLVTQVPHAQHRT